MKPAAEDLLMLLERGERNFAERKVFSDSKDWLKTVVAFANSTPVDYPAVLFIGVRNDGTPDEGTVNLDEGQKKLTKKLSQAYPPIYAWCEVLKHKGKDILAVVVPGSPLRPHFAGPSYVRKGSQTLSASQDQLDQLIAERNSKTYKILKWKGKPVTVSIMGQTWRLDTQSPIPYEEGTIHDCNQFYVTVVLRGAPSSYPLEIVRIAFDNPRDRLWLEIIAP